MNSSFSVIIPARLNSTRLPSKLLLPIAGKSMLRHVVERALSSDAKHVYVAADDQQLIDTLVDTDAISVVTSLDHASGTDRIVEAIQDLEFGPNDIVVNVQGDEPLIPSQVVNQVARLLIDRPTNGVASLYSTISNVQEIFDPNVVKVVLNSESHALYFSRAPMPWDRSNFADGEPAEVESHWYRHLGIYGYRVWALQKFASWSPSRLEQVERLEQLRFLENGISIVLDHVNEPVPAGVDTPDDLARVRELFATGIE
ncbi:MAG: 3-deoxy-manno-octulosonate cytidylyltransferase [Gammaproteobacteria bacterium]|nr:3-deoxy-manno-octulosonate cytidylyltransferase [Gammaproteobacteria bacterium]MYI77699.1 3-deoxy-manno-octulosonate cytidylyltransferase [Gammaproteobacteria bacterium]